MKLCSFHSIFYEKSQLVKNPVLSSKSVLTTLCVLLGNSKEDLGSWWIFAFQMKQYENTEDNEWEESLL